MDAHSEVKSKFDLDISTKSKTPNIEIDDDNGNVHVSSNVAGRALEEQDLPEIQINSASLSGQVGGHEIDARYKDGKFRLKLDNIEIDDENGDVRVSTGRALSNEGDL